MRKSTGSRPPRNAKPAKPRADFPLFAHATRRWAKKIRGRLHYFGPWSNPEGALQKYLEQKDDLHAGRKPRTANDGLTVRDLCNRFLTSKEHKLQTGLLSPHSFVENHAACKLVVEGFGADRLVSDLRPEDFEQLKFRFPATWGPLRRGKYIQRVRSLFRYASEQDLIDRPVKFGAEFQRPSRAALRVHRAKVRAQDGSRMFAAGELRGMIERAKLPLRAMILLAANTGFGNADCARLPLAALDLKGGWATYARGKTGIERRCPLWPETVAALREVIARRPKAKRPEHANLVFLTRQGLPWVKVRFFKNKDDKIEVRQSDALGNEFRKLLDKLKITRPGLGFYCLRRLIETVGGETRDQVAVDHIMGHSDPSMAAHYREQISDERLRAVAEHVRQWLFQGAATPHPAGRGNYALQGPPKAESPV